MTARPERGVLRWARQVASPNCDARPAGIEVTLAVLHSIRLPPGVHFLLLHLGFDPGRTPVSSGPRLQKEISVCRLPLDVVPT
jgi:hypothetical protein